MRLNRIHAILRRRVRYRITRGGALFILAIVVTGSGAFLSGNNLLFLVFSAMLALLLVSGFVSRLVLSGLELELMLPEHVAARMPVAARVRLRNLKGLTPSFSIELSGDAEAPHGTPSILRAPVYFPLIPGGGTIEVPVNVTFPMRGRHRENLFVIATRFPFGFLRKSTTVALRRETIVYPALEPGDGVEALLDSITGEIESHLRGDGRDFYRIRPYDTQDSARHVDWKSTAHTGGLQVREFTRDRQRMVEIFFDRRVPPGRRERFEQIVENCAFVTWRLAEREARMLVRSQRYALAVPEEGEIYDVLKFLALVEPLVTDSPGEEDEATDPANLYAIFRA
ncbi:MAG TPA: DUF58 domain-containing protein [Bryobacteraceae bacterium]|jgi:uncharacterized protein (DUF58 family)|nr:DUF58 domain-containing protein [Bryobacteraceae bacterium]